VIYKPPYFFERLATHGFEWLRPLVQKTGVFRKTLVAQGFSGIFSEHF
jgi:hypothetical protein